MCVCVVCASVCVWCMSVCVVYECVCVWCMSVCVVCAHVVMSVCVGACVCVCGV